MQDFIVDGTKVGLLRGSTIQQHDVLPFLEGKTSITTSAGSFNNTDFYSGSEFTITPDFTKHKYWIKFITNTGRIYYVPAVTVVHSYSFLSDDSILSPTNTGFSTAFLHPRFSHSLVFNTPQYSPSLISILLTIQSHSSAYLLQGSLSPTLVSIDYPQSLEFYSPSSISFNLILPDASFSPLTTSLPCLSFINFSIKESSFSSPKIPYYLLSSKVLQFSFLVSSLSDFLSFVSHSYTIDGVNYFPVSSFSFVEELPEPQLLSFSLQSVNSVIVHINH